MSEENKITVSLKHITRLWLKLQVLKVYHCYTLADEYENYPGFSVCFSVFKLKMNQSNCVFNLYVYRFFFFLFVVFTLKHVADKIISFTFSDEQILTFHTKMLHQGFFCCRL